MTNTPACPLNIGKKGQRRRFYSGMFLLALTLVVTTYLRAFAVPPAFWILLFIPYFASLLCLFQARAKTCVVLAFQNRQNLDQGSEPVKDSSAAQAIRQLAGKVAAKAALGAIVLTAISIFLAR